MEANDYWSLHHTPLFTSIDWSNGGQESYLDYDPKSAASYQQPLPPPPFQRRRSSSVDLPINPLFLNKVINEPTIIEEDFPFKTDKVVNTHTKDENNNIFSPIVLLLELDVSN